MELGAPIELRHDLFTLFNHVVGYCELILEDDEVLTDPVRRELVAISRAGRDAIFALRAVLSDESMAAGTVDRLTLVGALEGPLNTIERRCGELLGAAPTNGLEAALADLERIQRSAQRARSLAYHGTDPTHEVVARHRPPVAPVQAPASAAGGNGGLVLIVDDDADTSELLARRLGRLGYSTLTAGDGAQALDVLRSHPVDLVLLDLQMPVLDGFGVLERRRGDEQLRDIPFVMISSLDDVGSVVRCIEMGAEDYLPKPFDPVLLKARLGSCLERKRLRDQERKLVQQLAEWNSTLEVRARDQAEEMARLSRLRRFLSPQLADAVVSAGAESVLATHRRQIAVVFCDLRGFTRFAETAEPEDVMAVLRDFHDAMGRTIHDFGATVGYFAGDGLMAFFNDPVPCPDPAHRAVRMAVAMRDGMDDMTPEWKDRGHDLGFSVGVSFGYATLGEMGFEDRLEYGVIGSVVNLAARLCNRAEPGEILISQRARREVDGAVEVEERGLLTLAGFHDPVPAFTLVSVSEPG